MIKAQELILSVACEESTRTWILDPQGHNGLRIVVRCEHASAASSKRPVEAGSDVKRYRWTHTLKCLFRRSEVMRNLISHLESTRHLPFMKAVLMTLLLLAAFWLSFLVLTAGLAVGQCK